MSVITILRPHQWVKNIFVLAPLVFSRELFSSYIILARTLLGAMLFCLISGGVYIINDILDAPNDRLHPVKCKRPIAAGILSIKKASIFALILIFISFAGSFIIGWKFAFTLLIYVLINILYSFGARKLVIVDVGCIATGFLLRVIAGSYVAKVDASIWILICTFLVALFLALGKRYHELLTLKDGNTRPVLRSYSPTMIRILMMVTSGLTLLAYTIYTLSYHTRNYFNTDYLVVTVPFVAFGLWRFFKISIRQDTNESPTEGMVKDVLFVLNFVLWLIVVILLIYGI